MVKKVKLTQRINKPKTDRDLLAGLNDEQKIAVEHVDGPLLILAGAGSGKTRVITHRIAYLIENQGVYPSQILAVTFTNKAAIEMKERAMRLLEDQESARYIAISTFHSLCARLVRRHSDLLGLTPNYTIYDAADQLTVAKRTLESIGWESDRSTARTFLNYIDRQKNLGFTPEMAHEVAHNQYTEERANFYAEYQKAVHDNNAADFGDLILYVLVLFREHPQIANLYSNRWQYLMVDEYQDTNPAQNELLKHLTSQHTNLAVVGDDDQSIYSWRGATVENILSFEQQFPDCKIVKLERNYRSTKTILTAANDVIQKNEKRHPKKLWTENPVGEKISIYIASNEIEEAEWISYRIEKIAKLETPFSDIAVLYRTNAQSRIIEEQLLTRHIPYRIIGGLSFYERAEVKDLLAYLKLALNPASDVDFLRVINSPNRSIGKKTLEKIRAITDLPNVGSLLDALEITFGTTNRAINHPQYNSPEVDELRSLRGRGLNGIKSFLDIIHEIVDSFEENLQPTTILSNLIERTGFIDYLRRTEKERADDKIDNVGELVSAIAEYEATYQSVVDALADESDDTDYEPNSAELLSSFLERSALLTNADAIDEKLGAVTLMTVHGSKGLEFPYVFLTGMEEGLFPSLREFTDEESEEERRLAYVAITRAKTQLTITAATTRRIYGKLQGQMLSTFVTEINPDYVTVEAGSNPISRGHGGRPKDKFRRNPFDQRPQPTTFNKHNMDDDFVDNSITYIEEQVWEPDTDNTKKKKRKNLGTELKVGTMVSHPQFGFGKVVAISGDGEQAVITVNFPKKGQKKIIRKFLTILG